MANNSCRQTYFLVVEIFFSLQEIAVTESIRILAGSSEIDVSAHAQQNIAKNQQQCCQIANFRYFCGNSMSLRTMVTTDFGPEVEILQFLQSSVKQLK